jgi:hypothetical protein
MLCQVTDECTIRTNSPKFPHDGDFGCGQCSSKLEASQSELKRIMIAGRDDQLCNLMTMTMMPAVLMIMMII